MILCQDSFDIWVFCLAVRLTNNINNRNIISISWKGWHKAHHLEKHKSSQRAPLGLDSRQYRCECCDWNGSVWWRVPRILSDCKYCLTSICTVPRFSFGNYHHSSMIFLTARAFYIWNRQNCKKSCLFQKRNSHTLLYYTVPFLSHLSSWLAPSITYWEVFLCKSMDSNIYIVYFCLIEQRTLAECTTFFTVCIV